MVTPKVANDNEIIGIMGVARDITDVIQAEKFVENILHSVDEGFVVIDPEYRIVTANWAFCNMVKMDLPVL